MSEASIINRLQQKDENAFRELVNTYQHLVVNTCFGILHNTEDSEDVAQDVFIEVFRSINKFRSDSRLSTWLYRIAINRSLNFIRNNKRHKNSYPLNTTADYQLDKATSTYPGDNSSPQKNLEEEQRRHILHQAIDSLPKNQKIAFTLNKYDDLSYKKIAEVMSLSLSSVESLIHRAKKNLQKKLYHCYKKRCI